MGDETAKTTFPKREFLDALLAGFDQAWAPGSLDEYARWVPVEDEAFRRSALVELVKIDLKRTWTSGSERSVEEYLTQLPELGPANDVPAELVHCEYAIRRQCGKPVELTELARRFPQQIEHVRRLITSADEATIAFTPGEANTVSLQSGGQDESATRAFSRGETLSPDFGRYRIVRQLGAGAMGAVYLAHDTQLDRQVALKTPSFGGHPDLNAVQRFYREARLAATLRHPNICPIHDVGEIDGVHFITMAYIEGRPLSDYIRPANPVPLHGAAMAVRKLALALQHAHEHGVIHRDLKPANIMVDKTREPIVMDFGLARRADTADQTLKTQTGMILGTPSYMSPEQVEGDPDGIGPKTDQYSLGVILFELLTSQRPFQGSLAALIGKIATQQPPRPRELRDDVDPELEAICLKMMAKRVEDRFGSLKDAADVLGAYIKRSVNPSSMESVSADPPQSETELRESDLPEAAATTSDSETPSAKRAAQAADAELEEFLALQSLARNIPPRVEVLSAPHPLSSQSARKRKLSPATRWTIGVAALAAMVLLCVMLLIRAAQGPTREVTVESYEGGSNSAIASSPAVDTQQFESANNATNSVDGWIDLSFDQDLAGWRKLGAGQWRSLGAATMVVGDGHTTLISGQSFADFELTLEVLADRGGNGGIWFHLPADGRIEDQGYELQVAGSDGDRQSNYTGGIYAANTTVAKVNPPIAADGKWVALRLRVEDGRIQTWVDGKLAADMRGDPSRLQGGYLGLQGRELPPGVRVGYRNLRIRRLPESNDAAAEPSARGAPKTFVRLDELNGGGWGNYAWVSTDGRRVYWEGPAPSGDASHANWPWFAERAGADARFAGNRPLFDGGQPCLTADELMIAYVAKAEKKLRGASRPSINNNFRNFGPFQRLDSYVSANGPWLRDDGQYLHFSTTNDGATKYFVARRNQNRTWRQPTPMPIEWDESLGFITWISFTADGLSLLCTNETDGGTILLATRSTKAQSFANFRPIVVPGIGKLLGRCPRYVPETKELFLTAPEHFDDRDKEEAWRNPVRFGNIWVVRDFTLSSYR